MAVYDAGNPPVVASEGKTTNPADNAIVASTGALPAGVYDVRVTVGGSALALFDVARRNAADGADVGAVAVLYTPAATSRQFVFRYTLEASEILKIRMDGAVTGTVSATIHAERLT